MHFAFKPAGRSIIALLRIVVLPTLLLASVHCGGSVVHGDDGGAPRDGELRPDGRITPQDDSAQGVDAAGDALDPPDGAVDPAYLPNRRTYDQERDYIAWEGPVSYVTLSHRDSTSLPTEEGGASCTSGCTEQVTRMDDGGCVYGNFLDLCGFRAQFAFEPGAVGTAVVTACGQSVGNFPMAGTGTPGFNNLPAAGPWSPPTAGACVWRICATGGFVDFRAVTPTYCAATAPPAVDLKVNGTDGPILLDDPASYRLSWTSVNAVSCVTSGAWTGGVTGAGVQAVHDQAAGTYTYTITCVNSLGGATDAVSVNVQQPPG